MGKALKILSAITGKVIVPKCSAVIVAAGSSTRMGGVDKIDADGFIFDLDFILRRIGRSELYGLKYFRATVLVKFNSCCHVSSRTYRQGLLHMVKFRPILYLGNSIHYGRK